ncbi:MAG: peptidase S16 [Acidobacteria bacterium]|nr:peptidase S16 [Acidobacteriota bacterium]
MADQEGGTSKKRDLPDVLPVFPLRGTLLLPGCRLPLRVFEPRYLQMVEDALEGDRMIGVVQPLNEDDVFEPELQQIGCAGRVASVKQSEGGEYMIGLVGVARFGIRHEIASDKLYRLVEPNWAPIGSTTEDRSLEVDREELVANLRTYFDTHGLEANWRAIEASGDEELVNSLAMVCPFEPTEKQALLEAPDLERRSRLVIALMNMSVLPEQDSPRVH